MRLKFPSLSQLDHQNMPKSTKKFIFSHKNASPDHISLISNKRSVGEGAYTFWLATPKISKILKNRFLRKWTFCKGQFFSKTAQNFGIFFHHLFQTGLVNHCAKNQPICIFCLGTTAFRSWKIKIFQFSLIFQNVAILRHPNGQNMFSSDGSQYFHARSPPRIFFQLFLTLDLNRLRSLLNEAEV